MKKSKLELQSPGEAEAVFYEAFMHCDYEVMKALWADGDVVCVHPGTGLISSYASVIRSWQHIFSSAKTPQLKYTVEKQTDTAELSVHLVTEEIETGTETHAFVLATNVYQKFDSGWLMIEHHSSVVRTKKENRILQ